MTKKQLVEMIITKQNQKKLEELSKVETQFEEEFQTPKKYQLAYQNT
jgi:hypothetical protein